MHTICLEAPRFALSFAPQTIVARRAMPGSAQSKSSERMERVSRIVPRFDSPMSLKALFGMKRNARFRTPAGAFGTLHCAPITTRRDTLSGRLIV